MMGIDVDDGRGNGHRSEILEIGGCIDGTYTSRTNWPPGSPATRAKTLPCDAVCKNVVLRCNPSGSEKSPSIGCASSW
eukprot:1486816-Rhodomonas_salina.6